MLWVSTKCMSHGKGKELSYGGGELGEDCSLIITHVSDLWLRKLLKQAVKYFLPFFFKDGFDLLRKGMISTCASKFAGRIGKHQH